MTNVSGVVSYTLKKAWHCVAILLVFFAVLLSLFRLALPHFDQYKHWAEDFVAEKYSVNLTVGRIDAAWRGLGPSIVLSDVVMSQTESSPVHFSVEKVWVDINFWQSVSEGILISDRFDIKTPKLLVIPDNFVSETSNDYPIVKALKNLFLIQLQSFTIADGEVIVKTLSQEELYEIDELAWYNNDERHRGKGSIRVKELTNNSASFIVDLTGDTNSLSGTFYAKAEELDISPWLNEWVTAHYPLQESRTNLAAWLSIDDNAIEQLHIDLDYSTLLWAGNEETLLTEINGGTIQALPDGNSWNFRVDQLVVSQAGNTLVGDLVGRSDSKGYAVINTAKPISLQPVSSILSLFTGDQFSGHLLNMNMDGELSTLQVKWESQNPSIRAEFHDVSWEAVDTIPGVDSLDVSVLWDDGKGRVDTHTKNAQLDLRNLNGQIISDANLDINAYFYFDQNALTPSWVISLPRLDLTSDKLSLYAEAEYQLTSNFMQVALRVDPLSVNQVPDLLPGAILNKNAVDFLSKALAGRGDIEAADLIWSGKPQHFPFNDNQGVFQACVTVRNADFAFSPKWPMLTGLDMTLLFENNGLFMHSPQGYLDNVKLQNANAVVSSLTRSKSIVISAEGHSTGKNVASLLQKTTLTKLSSILNEKVLIDGDLNASLNLEVPFERGALVTAHGAIHLQDSTVSVPNIKVDFEQSNGVLSFNNSDISAVEMSGLLYNQPVLMSLTGKQAKTDYLLDIDINGRWDIDKTFDYFNLPLTDQLDGEFQWNGKVNTVLTATGVTFEGKIKTDLVGVSSALPGPLYKSVDDTQMLVVDVVGETAESQLTLSLGNDIGFKGTLNHTPLTFTDSLLTIGNNHNFVPTENHAVLASLSFVQFEPWAELQQNINEHYASVPKREVSLLTVPQRVYLNTATLAVAGRSFDNARVNVKQENNTWQIDLTSKQASGNALVPDQWRDQGIDIFAEKLYLSLESGVENDNSDRKPLDISFPLRFKCDDCRVNGLEIGKIDLALSQIESGVNIDRLLVNRNNISLNVTGGWNTDGNSVTSLNGHLKSDDFGQWLDSLGLTSGIKDSEADATFDINWSGSPTEFDLAHLSGSLDWELSDGYLSQVSDKGARIFTLFSLNSLVRKLSLDFRDVFAQGFFYDDIKGTMTIENGRASTNDTIVDGGAGEIEIVGYSQLDTEILNYNINFTPNVTGNLPFLVYFLASPPTALAALALDQVLTSAKVISNINYQLTGTFSEPVVQEVDRDSKDIQLPAQQNTPVDDAPLPATEVPLSELDGVKENVVQS